VAGISLIMQTNEQVDDAAELLRAVGLDVTGEDGYVEVTGTGLNLSIMRGTMIDMPAHGGLLVQVKVADLPAALQAAQQAGAVLGLAPERAGESAFLQSRTGFTLELQPAES
jgi:hypothetical protein